MDWLHRFSPSLSVWRRHDAGASAIEFGMVAPLFLGMALACFDAGSLMAKSMLLDRSLDKAIRLMRTDGATRPKTADDFKTKVCGELILFKQDCQENLVVEMTVVKGPSSFPTTATPCISQTVAKPAPSYATGGRSQAVFVRACLSSPPLVPLIAEGLGFKRNDLGRFDVVSVSGFLNEPGAGDGQ